MNQAHVNLNVPGAGVLFVVFAILKMVNVIDWSWVWVTSPLWIAAGIVIVKIIIAIIVLAILELKS